MFHPTIFDNIKVVLEGAVYDSDFDGVVTVTNRSDVVDLATYYRLYQIEFRLAAEQARFLQPIIGQIQMRTTLADIASEQLEHTLTDRIGCTICIHFRMEIGDVERETEAILQVLNEIWGHRPHITQQITAHLDQHRQSWPPDTYENKIILDFHRKIDEGNIEDMRHLVDHAIQSLIRLEQVRQH